MSGPCVGTPAPRITQTAPEAPTMETGGHKSTVPEPGWFDRNRRGFKDWWRAMRLYLKANRITGAEDKVTAVLSMSQTSFGRISTNNGSFSTI